MLVHAFTMKMLFSRLMMQTLYPQFSGESQTIRIRLLMAQLIVLQIQHKTSSSVKQIRSMITCLMKIVKLLLVIYRMTTGRLFKNILVSIIRTVRLERTGMMNTAILEILMMTALGMLYIGLLMISKLFQTTQKTKVKNLKIQKLKCQTLRRTMSKKMNRGQNLRLLKQRKLLGQLENKKIQLPVLLKFKWRQMMRNLLQN